jgi:hypothetical protein
LDRHIGPASSPKIGAGEADVRRSDLISHAAGSNGRLPMVVSHLFRRFPGRGAIAGWIGLVAATWRPRENHPTDQYPT